jgi:hypothetical protein
MEAWIARRADVHHCWDVETYHLFIKRIPIAVGERRILPVATRWIRIQITAYEPEFFHASPKLWNAVTWRDTWGLGELTDTNEIVGEKFADAMN